MSACYFVSFDVRFTDEEKAKQSLKDFIYNAKQTNFNLDHFEGHVDLDTVDGLLQVIIGDWDFCSDFRTDEMNGWISYNSNFNASYSWEGVLQDMFDALLPDIDPKSTLRIEPDNGYYILGVDCSGDELKAVVLEEGEECDDEYESEECDDCDDECESEGCDERDDENEVIMERLKKTLTEIGLSDESIETVINTKTPKEIYDEYIMKSNVSFNLRICSVCGNWMIEGYVVEMGAAYYCSKECMHADGMSDEEFQKLCDEDDSQTYYTEWY